MINVIVADPYSDKIDLALITAAAEAVLNQPPGAVDADVSVVIEDDERLRQLNRDYSGIDAATDVLSFASGDGVVDPETERSYLGDVIISFPRAEEQAAAAGHLTQDELQLLVVHGILHLLGHDHAEPEEKERMWAAQNAILSQLDVKIKRLPE